MDMIKPLTLQLTQLYFRVISSGRWYHADCSVRILYRLYHHFCCLLMRSVAHCIICGNARWLLPVFPSPRQGAEAGAIHIKKEETVPSKI